MNKFAIVFLTAVMTLANGAALAAGSSDGSANAAADAGAVAPGAKNNLAPNHIDNSKINMGSTDSVHQKMKHHEGTSAAQTHENGQCKDGNCPNINEKARNSATTKTDGTTH